MTFNALTRSVAYLGCVKGALGGLEDGSPSIGSRDKAPVGGLRNEVPISSPEVVPQEIKLFVNECINFDVLKKKISKMAKYHHHKLGLAGGGRRKPLSPS